MQNEQDIKEGICCDKCLGIFEKQQQEKSTCPDCFVELSFFENKGHIKSLSDTK